jgi:hypothetical protein
VDIDNPVQFLDRCDHRPSPGRTILKVELVKTSYRIKNGIIRILLWTRHK